MPTLTAIYRYPIKGMSPERLPRCDVSAGEGLPFDRAYALAHGSTRFVADAPEWLEKTNFLMLLKNERLAALETGFDPATKIMTVKRDGKVVARGNLGDRIGRATIEQFFAAYLKDQIRGAPKIVAAPGHVFMDVPEKVVTLINAASVKDLERVVGRAVDPLRFRGNLLIEDAPAWSEFDWIGKTLRIGETSFKVLDRIQRCAATNVDPKSAQRDMQIPKALQTGYGHVDLGVYLTVSSNGTIAEGDALTLE